MADERFDGTFARALTNDLQRSFDRLLALRLRVILGRLRNNGGSDHGKFSHCGHSGKLRQYRFSEAINGRVSHQATRRSSLRIGGEFIVGGGGQ